MLRTFLHVLLNLKRPYKTSIQMVSDLTFIIVAFVGSMLIRLENFSFSTSVYERDGDVVLYVFYTSPYFLFEFKTWAQLFVVAIISIFIFFLLGIYRSIIRYVSSNLIKHILIGTCLSSLLVYFFSLVFKTNMANHVPLIFFIILSIFVGGSRFVFRQLYFSSLISQRKRVAIYGAGEAGRQLLNIFYSSEKYIPVTFIDDDTKLSGMKISNLIIRSFADFKKRQDNLRVDAIFIAIPNVSQDIRNNILNQLENYPAEIKIISNVDQFINLDFKIEDLRFLTIEELLGREPVPPLKNLMKKNIEDKVVLVSGAGGSIGSELSKQILFQKPRKLILLEISEYALYSVLTDLKGLLEYSSSKIELVPAMCSVQNKNFISKLLKKFSVDTIYHAAAYKHVPLVENNVVESIRNNVIGTKNLTELAVKYNVKNFILVSTDKAVRPTNFMGCTKRLSELICQAHHLRKTRTTFSMVRFGNVLGSSGSVLPLFEKQIEEGGPITVTHRDINRFFMTIPEAAQLVLQAGAMARGGEVFILDMGKPIKIIDLAFRMARLRGLNPYVAEEENPGGKCIPVTITGLRKGEKLFEELWIGNNPVGTDHPRIMSAKEKNLPYNELEKLLRKLSSALELYDLESIKELFLEAPLDFQPVDEISDIIWKLENNSMAEKVVPISAMHEKS